MDTNFNFFLFNNTNQYLSTHYKFLMKLVKSYYLNKMINMIGLLKNLFLLNNNKCLKQFM